MSKAGLYTIMREQFFLQIYDTRIHMCYISLQCISKWYYSVVCVLTGVLPSSIDQGQLWKKRTSGSSPSSS